MKKVLMTVCLMVCMIGVVVVCFSGCETNNSGCGINNNALPQNVQFNKVKDERMNSLLENPQNVDKKFELTSETARYCRECGRVYIEQHEHRYWGNHIPDYYITLYRIKSLWDFGNIKAGDLGGFVAGEYNLSHKGNCWIYDNSAAYDGALVAENAVVGENSKVFGNALICGNAVVFQSNISSVGLCGNARISNSTVNGGGMFDGTLSGATYTHQGDSALQSSVISEASQKALPKSIIDLNEIQDMDLRTLISTWKEFPAGSESRQIIESRISEVLKTNSSIDSLIMASKHNSRFKELSCLIDSRINSLLSEELPKISDSAALVSIWKKFPANSGSGRIIESRISEVLKTDSDLDSLIKLKKDIAPSSPELANIFVFRINTLLEKQLPEISNFKVLLTYYGQVSTDSLKIKFESRMSEVLESVSELDTLIHYSGLVPSGEVSIAVQSRIAKVLKQNSDLDFLIARYIAYNEGGSSMMYPVKNRIFEILRQELPKITDVKLLEHYGQNLWINSDIRIMIDGRIEQILGPEYTAAISRGPFSKKMKQSISENDGIKVTQ